MEVCRAGLFETVAEMNERYHKEEGANLRKVLEIADWCLRRTAVALEIRQDMLQKMLERHPELETEQKEKMEEPYGSKKSLNRELIDILLKG